MINKYPNKDGKMVEISEELRQDMIALHNLDPVELFRNFHGTFFFIEKTYDQNRERKDFTLTTDDDRDEVIKWSLRDKKD